MSFIAKEKFSNRVLSRSQIGNATGSRKFISNDKEVLLEKLSDIDKSSSIVYSIREELIANVMEKCYARYIEKQSVKFMVHCAYRALTDIINLFFLEHDSGMAFENLSSWTPDIPPEPSPPDTWASHSVPVACELEEVTTELEVPYLSKTSEKSLIESTNSQFGAKDSLGQCSNFLTKTSACSEVIGGSSLLLGPNTSEVFLEEHLPEEEELKTEMSDFTKLATSPKNVYSSRTDSENSKAMEKLTMYDRKSVKALPERVSLSLLPPIRADALLQRNISRNNAKKGM